MFFLLNELCIILYFKLSTCVYSTFVYTEYWTHNSIKFSKRAENKQNKRNICCTQPRCFIDSKYSHTRARIVSTKIIGFGTFGDKHHFRFRQNAQGKGSASFEMTLWRCITEELLRESLKSRQTGISNRYSYKH